jgi:hypothetical protein
MAIPVLNFFYQVQKERMMCNFNWTIAFDAMTAQPSWCAGHP